MYFLVFTMFMYFVLYEEYLACFIHLYAINDEKKNSVSMVNGTCNVVKIFYFSGAF